MFIPDDRGAVALRIFSLVPPRCAVRLAFLVRVCRAGTLGNLRTIDDAIGSDGGRLRGSSPDGVPHRVPRSRCSGDLRGSGRALSGQNWTSLASRRGPVNVLPVDVFQRPVEIMLDRQTTLAVAMTGPKLLTEPELGDMGLRDFNWFEEALEARRRAARAPLPKLMALLESPSVSLMVGERELSLRVDPFARWSSSRAEPGRRSLEKTGRTTFAQKIAATVSSAIRTLTWAELASISVAASPTANRQSRLSRAG